MAVPGVGLVLLLVSCSTKTLEGGAMGTKQEFAMQLKMALVDAGVATGIGLLAQRIDDRDEDERIYRAKGVVVGMIADELLRPMHILTDARRAAKAKKEQHDKHYSYLVEKFCKGKVGM